MRLKLIACDVLFREFSHYAAISDHVVDVDFLPQGLHRDPILLRNKVQEAIDKTEELHGQQEVGSYTPLEYDAILLGYCLCSNGIIGLTSKKLPLIIPRGHDCITLLLGSKERYQEYFNSHRGVYWYSAGWIDRTTPPGKKRYEQIYQTYVEKYGEDNADYLMDMEQNWFKEYSWATYINWGFPKDEHYRRFTQQAAEFLGWQFDEIAGDPVIIEKMIEGQWDQNLFLKVQPGEVVAPSYDELIICNQCCQG